jgi:transcriptional regulator with XRE-family HTH domain
VSFGCQATGISVTLDDVSSQSLAVVVGGNCKRIRAEIGITQDELARWARLLGLRWNAAKVGDFEAGRSAPTFVTVLAVTLALQMALEGSAETRGEIPEWGVTLADLVAGEGQIALTDNFSVPAAQVEAVCRGRIFTAFDPQYRRPERSMQEEIQDAIAEQRGISTEELARQRRDEKALFDKLIDLRLRSGLTEHRLAKRLNISPARLADLSFELWQSTFSEERDRRAGPDANQQKRGQVSRALRAELEIVIADGND